MPQLAPGQVTAGRCAGQGGQIKRQNSTADMSVAGSESAQSQAADAIHSLHSRVQAQAAAASSLREALGAMGREIQSLRSSAAQARAAQAECEDLEMVSRLNQGSELARRPSPLPDPCASHGEVCRQRRTLS